MTFFFFLSLIAIIAYVYLLMYITNGWDDTPEATLPEDYRPEQGVSIIIPARNEANNIISCLNSIYNNDFPREKYEVIVMDDHSEDGTGDLIREHFPETKIWVMDHAHGKKASLHQGILESIYDFLLFTDADTIVGKDWIKSNVWAYENKRLAFATGPVYSTCHNDVLTAFQFLDFAGMAQITANGIYRNNYFIANGANMAISKTMYHQIGGMADHAHIASGDDMFLIHAVASIDHGQVHYIKSPDAAVATNPLLSWKELLVQRKRWASKTKDLPRDGAYKIQVFIFIIHVLILFNFCLIPWSDGLSLFGGIFMLFIKGCIDFLFLAKSARYFGHTQPLKYFIPAFFFYFFYIFYMAFHAVIGGEYRWKGREVK